MQMAALLWLTQSWSIFPIFEKYTYYWMKFIFTFKTLQCIVWGWKSSGRSVPATSSSWFGCWRPHRQRRWKHLFLIWEKICWDWSILTSQENSSEVVPSHVSKVTRAPGGQEGEGEGPLSLLVSHFQRTCHCRSQNSTEWIALVQIWIFQKRILGFLSSFSMWFVCFCSFVFSRGRYQNI